MIEFQFKTFTLFKELRSWHSDTNDYFVNRGASAKYEVSKSNTIYSNYHDFRYYYLQLW